LSFFLHQCLLYPLVHKTPLFCHLGLQYMFAISSSFQHKNVNIGKTELERTNYLDLKLHRCGVRTYSRTRARPSSLDLMESGNGCCGEEAAPNHVPAMFLAFSRHHNHF
jgi:hypothetical protein